MNKFKIQVLVATMNQIDHSLLQKMNIDSDAIVANQCDSFSREDFLYNNHKITFLNLNERGVGLNRNNALMRATGDICVFADDDMVFVDDYVNILSEVFESQPDADVIIFNLFENPVQRYVIKRKEKISYFNYLRYGTARIAIRLSSVRKKGIYFNQCFGGGTEHCHGEDNLFLAECLNKNLKIYGYPLFLAKLLNERSSTWLQDYDIKYLKDQGCLYYTISNRWGWFLCLQDAIRRNYKNFSWCSAFLTMLKSGCNYFLDR